MGRPLLGFLDIPGVEDAVFFLVAPVSFEGGFVQIGQEPDYRQGQGMGHDCLEVGVPAVLFAEIFRRPDIGSGGLFRLHGQIQAVHYAGKVLGQPGAVWGRL